MLQATCLLMSATDAELVHGTRAVPHLRNQLTSPLVAVALIASLFFSACSNEPNIPTDVETVLSGYFDDGGLVTLTVPANTYAHDMDGDLSTGTASIDAAALEASAQARAITPVVSLRFSRAQIALGARKMTLEIEIAKDRVVAAEAARKTLYALLRTRGSVDFERSGSPTQGWREALGSLRFDAQAQKYFLTLPLYATSSELDIVAVESAGFAVVLASDATSKTFRSAPSAENSPFRHAWAVLCHGSFDNPDDCSPTSGPDTPVRQILKILRKNSDWFVAKGWTDANLSETPKSQLDVVSVDRRQPLVADPTSGPIFNAVIVRKGTWCGRPEYRALGCYDPHTNIIELSLAVLDPARRSLQGTGDTIAHELFHAVQAAEVPHLLARANAAGNEHDPAKYWIIEGTASAIGMWRLANEDPVLSLSARRGGVWREWSAIKPLNSVQDANLPYQTFEFFTALQDGSLDYFRSWFSALNAADQSKSVYEIADSAFEAALGVSLREQFELEADDTSSYALLSAIQEESALGLAFLKLLKQRSPVAGYPHCSWRYELDAPSGSTGVYQTAGFFLDPMSADCVEIASKDHFARHGEACLKIFNSAAQVTPHQALLLSGAYSHNASGRHQRLSFGEEPLFIQSDRAYLQVADLDFKRSLTSSADQSEYMELRFMVDQNCGADQEEIGSCYPTKVVCNYDTCSLVMQMPGSDCSASIVTCRREGGCTAVVGGTNVPWDPGVCLTTASILRSGFTSAPEAPPVTYGYTGLPAHGQCGNAEACRRIILCPK